MTPQASFGFMRRMKRYLMGGIRDEAHRRLVIDWLADWRRPATVNDL